MNKNILIGVLGVIVIALIIFLGLQSKKVTPQIPIHNNYVNSDIYDKIEE